MIRLLIVLGVLFLIGYLAVFFAKRSLRRWLQQVMPQQQPSQNPQALTEQLVKCVSCDTFFPLSRAIRLKDQVFCCQEHADLSK